MHKNTKLSRLKIRWLNTRGLILLLITLCFSFFQVQAQTFSYTGSVQTVTLPAGTYDVEMWGANGGVSGTLPDGVGGYAKGGLNLTATTTIYIVIGGTPTYTGSTGLQPGGYNGGGSGYANSSGRAGGGATHIATASGILSSLVNNQSAVLMVAGGGGGYQNSGVIGDGGGLTGGGNYPGTQTGSSGSTTALAGSFGQGGNITASYGGGGGGGWYGGGADQNNAGSGGSGYIGGVSSGLTVSPGQSGFVPNPDTAGNGTVIITSTVPCTGTPSAGTASITTINACSSTLSVSGATLGGGITYQWQSLPAGASTFTDIPGAVSASHNLTVIPVATDYRCVVTCTLSSNSDTSNVVSVAASGSSNFSENFDTIPVGSTTNPSLPECWSYIDDVVSTGYGYTIASNPLSGANVFRLYRTNSTRSEERKSTRLNSSHVRSSYA